MKNKALFLLSLIATLPNYSSAGIINWQGLRGYTVVTIDSVQDVFTNSMGNKYIKLSSGATFRADLLLLEPLQLTEVVVFARQSPSDLKLKLYKLIIDDEVVDAYLENAGIN